ncbi:hypothetical protein RRG08_031508 [Elysia crispata]|uniref:Uncharacterized protein n=1 Tax=Elysia crispata TaxID=231223 RepID=A0AAE1CPA0_9GAST|nr:hypothetical protein RRG08_031508 [Elysia crispata]
MGWERQACYFDFYARQRRRYTQKDMWQPWCFPITSTSSMQHSSDSTRSRSRSRPRADSSERIASTAEDLAKWCIKNLNLNRS